MAERMVNKKAKGILHSSIFSKSKRGQVTIFVIIALVILAGVAFYFAFRGTLFSGGLSVTFEPVESSFLNCIQEKTETGIKIMGSKGGYIENPEFVSGSGYMPYSSELDFLGVGIPYWRSVSGSNIPINQIPTKQEMQNQLANYIELGVQDCNFETFSSQGYSIQSGPAVARVTVRGNSVDVSLNMDLNLEKDDETAVVSNHDVTVNSQFGNLYGDAVDFYNFENEGMILENYSVDVLRTYAPVDGFELSCSPKIWNADEIFDTLRNATQDNFFALKNSGRSDDYFNLKVPIDSEIRIINSRNWPSVYEVEPANSPVLVAEPIGNQQGMGIIGFCYVPYHFVYNLRYPVLVRLSRGGETFQFPLAINIEGNVARKIGSGSSIPETSIDLCTEGSESTVTVSLVDSLGNAVDGSVSYECFSSKCQIGETQNGVLTGSFPQCVNGKVIVESEGYRKVSHIFSTVEGGSTSIVMDRIYTKTVLLNFGNTLGNEKAIIIFNSESTGESYTLSYPEQNQVSLPQGAYSIQVYAYDDSELTFEATTTTQCVDVPSGIGGLIGITHKECTSIDIPEQTISNVLVAGGRAQAYFSEADLAGNNKIRISVDRYNTPTSLQELQIVYTLVESKNLEVVFI